ncbi:MAG TPA: branched-chain amino acid transaminase [Acidobacteriota bacterium]
MVDLRTDKIWHNGRFIPWDQAQIHVLSHVIHYGSAIFEGLRCYRTERGPAVFRLRDHLVRLLQSCHTYRMDPPYSLEELHEPMLELVRVNRLQECYLRPLVLRGFGSMGINPLKCPIETYLIAWPWGRYFGQEALDEGIDAQVSSWNRLTPNTIPALAKGTGQYLNSQLIRMEAVVNGYTEGIALSSDGYVSEASGMNLFLVAGGKVVTPPPSASILLGITRDSVITLLRDLGMAVTEQHIAREMLYTADEVFLTGTAAEITPVRSVDRIRVGGGARGPITRQLQEEYFGLTSGKREKDYGWLDYVYDPKPAAD